MKQGRASRDNNDGRKVEPVVKKISPASVSQIGTSLGNHSTENGQILPGASKPLYAGRGFMAPTDQRNEVFKSGSQRRS